MKSTVKFFSSVKLAIVLLIIITIASILGTFIPQQRSQAEYVMHYGQLSSLLMRLEFTNLYHSLWYISLLLLFAINILVCTLKRLTPKLRKTFNPVLEIETKKLQALKFKDNLKKNWKLETTKENLSSLLASHHYRLKEKKKENRIFLLARKKRLGAYGSDIVHFGLLIILLGGIISGFSGFRDNLSISEGQTLAVPNAGFKLRLDKFETDYYPNGSVKDWRSTLTVIENEESVLTQSIEVNHPLSYKGFVFYQSSYGWDWNNLSLEIWIKKKKDPSFLEKKLLKTREKAKVNQENIEFAVLQFLPDFVLNERNMPVNRSDQPNNPAAYIEGLKGEEKVFSGWIFAKFPDFARIHETEETDLIFELKDFKAAQYSGIQLAKDPGTNFIWLGCIILMAGLCVAFYWPTREIKVILEKNQDQTEIIAGGIASKNKEELQSEFEKIMMSLRKSK